jgi:thiamine-phosphate pyrophosphorylase
MSLEHARQMRDLGFGGIVVCGDLWNLFDIHNQTDYKSVLTHFERLRSAIG